MDLRSSRLPNSAPRVTIIDGSTGLRLAIAGLVHEHFPKASIEDIDPFSQTMRGAGLAVSSTGNAIVLGGVGTEAEARDALKRLCGGSWHPPIVMLVAQSLLNLRSEFIAAGAFEVMRKDAISGRRLQQALARALVSPHTGETNPQELPSEPANTSLVSPHATYGKFLFIEDGERVGLDIDGYRPVETLSNGAMAQVYLAESIDSGGKVAVKILTSVPIRHVAEVAQLVTITQRLRPLRGKSVVHQLDSGISANFPYIVLEFLSKGDLRRRLKTPIDDAEAVRIMLSLLTALNDLHAVEVCHADLKPESVFFRADGSITLIDFNISTLFGQAVRFSAVGDQLGTPTYMSPEQGAGHSVTGRSDLYAAGIIFFEMLTGAPPFVGDTPAQTIFRHLHDEIPLLPIKVRRLQAIVDKMLAKSVDDRFQHASEIIDALTATGAAVGTNPT